MNEFTKEYRINKPKSIVFLHISNEQSPNEIKKTILNLTLPSPPLFPLVTVSLFSTSVILFLSCK